MNPPRSTLRLPAATLGGPEARTGPEGRAGGHLPAGAPPGLLVPLVRRALTTGRGPEALLAWLRGRTGRLPAREPTESLALALAWDLLRLLPDARPGLAGG